MTVVIQLLSKALIGAAIGIAVVAIFIGIDYAGQTNKRLYLIDYGDSIVAVLTIGVFVGTFIGLAWAANSIRRSDSGERPSA